MAHAIASATAMGPSQIVGVDDVELEGEPARRVGLVDFYRDLVGLEWVRGGTGSDGRTLRFRSGRIELRYALVPVPRLSPIFCRLLVAVPRLDEGKRLLERRRVAYEEIRGLDYTDRRVSLLDPAGNRVELKQDWFWAF